MSRRCQHVSYTALKKPSINLSEGELTCEPGVPLTPLTPLSPLVPGKPSGPGNTMQRHQTKAPSAPWIKMRPGNLDAVYVAIRSY